YAGERKGLAAVDGAELDPSIEGVAHVVGAEADDDLVRAHAFAREPRVKALVQPLQGLLDDRRAALREREVGGGTAGAAGVAHHLHAGLAHTDLERHLAQPDRVLR